MSDETKIRGLEQIKEKYKVTHFSDFKTERFQYELMCLINKHGIEKYWNLPDWYISEQILEFIKNRNKLIISYTDCNFNKD